jgi:predicted RNA-binding protein with PUA-like domain
VTTYLLKTEPGEYSYADLVRDKHAVWDGVANPAACAALRAMVKGDEAWIYHTGDEKAIVGLARVMRPAFHDPQQPEGFTASGEIKHPVVELKPLRAVATPVTLAQIKADPRFKDFSLVKQARLSVMPVPAPLDKILRELTGIATA